SAPAYRVISCNTPRLPSPLLFPYTTLFRSALVHAVAVTVTVASAGIAVAVAVAVTGLAVAVASAGIAVAVTRAALLGWLAVAGRVVGGRLVAVLDDRPDARAGDRDDREEQGRGDSHRAMIAGAERRSGIEGLDGRADGVDHRGRWGNRVLGDLQVRQLDRLGRGHHGLATQEQLDRGRRIS